MAAPFHYVFNVNFNFYQPSHQLEVCRNINLKLTLLQLEVQLDAIEHHISLQVEHQLDSFLTSSLKLNLDGSPYEHEIDPFCIEDMYEGYSESFASRPLGAVVGSCRWGI